MDSKGVSCTLFHDFIGDSLNCLFNFTGGTSIAPARNREYKQPDHNQLAEALDNRWEAIPVGSGARRPGQRAKVRHQRISMKCHWHGYLVIHTLTLANPVLSRLTSFRVCIDRNTQPLASSNWHDTPQLCVELTFRINYRNCCSFLSK